MNMERSSSLGTKALKPPHLPSQNQVSPNLDLGGIPSPRTNFSPNESWAPFTTRISRLI